MSYDAGTAYVSVIPSFRGVAAAIRAEAERWGQSVESALSSAVRRGLSGGAGGAAGQGGQAGAAYGQSFADTVRARVSAALKNLPTPKIDANSTPAERKIADLRAQLRSIQANVGVSLDSGQALARIEAIQAELKALAASDPSVDIRVDSARALAQLAALKAELDAVDKTHTVDVRLEGGFATRVRSQIDAALKQLPEGLIDVNTGQADVKLAELRARLETLRNQRVGIDIDAASAIAELSTIQGLLKAFAASRPTVDVRVDAGRAKAELAALEAEIKAIGKSGIDFDVDTSKGVSAFQGLLAAGILLAPALIPVGAAITAAFAGVAVAIAGIVAAIGVVAFAVVPVVKALMAVSAANKSAGADAARSAEQQANAAYAIESANRQVAAAQEGVTRARANAARSAEDSARRVADAEENAARASEDAARTVANAQRSASEASAKAARDVEDAQAHLADVVEENAQRREQALNSLASAERAYRREQQQIADDVERAEKAVTDARREAASTAEDSARQVASALKQQQAAERTLRDAQAASLKAQKDLNDARTTATRRLEDLQAASKQGSLDEKQATLDLQKARQDLANLDKPTTQHDPITGETIVTGRAASPEDRARAELAVSEAQQRLNDVQRENTRTAEDLTAAQAKGVEGSDEVVSAQERVAQTAEQAQLAEADLQQARIDYTRAQRDEIEKNRLAQEALNEALARQVELAQSLPDRRAEAAQQVGAARSNVSNVADDNGERLTAARKAVTDAQAAQVKAAQDGARAVADAQRAQTRAVEDGTKAVADAQRAQAVSAEQSAQQITSAQQSLADARRNAAHAIASSDADISASSRKADEALAGLSPAGRAFVDFLRNQLGPAFSGFSKVAQQGLLPGVQAGLAALLPVLPKVKGFIGEIAGVLGDMAASAGKALAGPEFAGFFSTLSDQLPGIVRLLGSVGGNLTKAFAGLFIGILPLGVSALESFNGLLARFVTWTNGLSTNNGFQSFLDYAKDSLPLVGAFLGNLFQAMGRVIQVAAPFGALVLAVLSGIFDLISKIPPAVLAGLFLAIGAAIAALAGGAIAAALAITLLGIGATYLVSHFGDIVDSIRGALGPAFTWLNDSVVQPVKDGIVSAFKTVRDFITGAVDAVVSFVRDHWKLLTALLLGPVALAALGISAHWDSIKGYFSSARDWVADKFKAGWDKVTAILAGPVDAARATIGSWNEGTGIVGGIKKGIDGALSWVTDTFGPAWKKVSGLISDPIASARDAVGSWAGGGILGGLHSAFTAAVNGLGSVFDGLRALFAAPFVFLIDTVINGGLIGAYNKIAGLIPGLGKIDSRVDSSFLKPKSRSNPGGYATGGIYPGYTPGRDIGYIGVSGGEAIMRPEWTRAVGPDYVDAGNAAARKGGVAGVRKFLGGFDLGGIVGGAVSGIKGAAGAVGGFVLGNLKKAVRAVMDPLLDQLQAFGGGGIAARMAYGVANRLTGGLLGLAGANDAQAPPPGEAGLPPASGPGVVTKPVNGPYGLGFGNTYSGGGFHSGQDFPVPNGTPVGAALEGVVEYVKLLTTSYGRHVAMKHPNGAETLYAHMSNPIVKAGQQLAAGQLLGYSGNTGHVSGAGGGYHLHFEYRRPPGGYSNAIDPRNVIGTKVYDQGGYLSPGLQMVYNGTGKPEPVLTTQQLNGITGGDGAAALELQLRRANSTLNDLNAGVTRAYRALEAAPAPSLQVGV